MSKERQGARRSDHPKHGFVERIRIAEAAGVSVGTVYEYFVNKEAVFGAVIDRELRGLVIALQARDAPRGASIGETLGHIVIAGMSAMRYGPELYRALEAVPGATFRRSLGDARVTVIHFVRALLEEYRAELRVSDLDLAAFVVVSAAEGIAGNATRDRFDARLGAEVVSLLNLYLTGTEAG